MWTVDGSCVSDEVDDNGADLVLVWGVLARFRDYVSSLEDGQETWAPGADAEEPGRFPLIDDRREGDVRTLKFSGSVRFFGHSGFLNVTIGSPHIRIAGEAIEVSIDSAPPGVSERRICFAKAASTNPMENRLDVMFDDLRLTEEGAVLLGSVYSAGEKLDVASIRPRLG